VHNPAPKSGFKALVRAQLRRTPVLNTIHTVLRNAIVAASRENMRGDIERLRAEDGRLQGDLRSSGLSRPDS